MYHTSPVKIEKGMINSFGVAGSCLFFSDNVYQMSQASVYVYEADFDCIPAYKLHDEEVIGEIAEKFGVSEEEAEMLLNGSSNEWDLDEMDAEKSWWLQGKRGEAAVKMGYDGCEDEDEQGAVYIVPMLGREEELELISH